MRRAVPDWIRERFELLTTADRVALVRADVRDILERRHLLSCAVDRPMGGKPVAGGRGDASIVRAGSLGDVVVRPYRRGGLMRHVVRRRYVLGSRALDELVLTVRLRRELAPVPDPLAAVEQRLRPGPGYAACLITRLIGGTVPAARYLETAGSGEVTRTMEAIGRAIRSCHEAGGWHADLNAWNLLVPDSRPDLSIFVVDWDRGRWFPGGVPPREAERNLSRLGRSLRKLELHGALDAWAELLGGYESGPLPDPAA